MKERVAIDRIKYFNIDNLQYPIHLRVDLTGKCNQNCFWCFYHGGYDKKQKVERIKDLREQVLQTAGFLQFLDSARSIVRAITISGGGEPLIHPKIDLILEKIIKSGFKFGVITNLSMKLEDSTIKLLRKAQWIRVSVDGCTKDTYNKIHRPKDEDAFFNVTNNMLSLYDNELTIGASFLIHKINEHEIGDFINFAWQNHFNYVQFKSVYDETWGYNYDEKKVEEIDLQIKELITLFPKIKIFGNLKNRINAMRYKVKDNVSCQISRYRIQLGADGYLYPCCMFKYVKKYRYGSIYTNTFKEIMDSKKRHYVDFNLQIDKCPPCWDKPFQDILIKEYKVKDYNGNEVDVEFV